jgi:hypothetical protein
MAGTAGAAGADGEAGADGAAGAGGTGGGTAGADGTAGSGGSGGVVEIPGMTCGPAVIPAITVGGREVMVNYPCGKSEGTKVTFILNLHGTQAQESLKFYGHAYLGAYKYVDSHNIVVVSPKSVVSQWGNGDGGRDRPHILEVIDWTYQTFSAFNITSMWVAGHSWGAMYARTFVCDPAVADKTTGVILQSGGAQLPQCANDLSIIGTVGETDIVPGQPDQTGPAAAHGCGAASVYSISTNTITEWPNCSPGWAHKNYMLLGKGHGFSPVDWPEDDVTKDIADTVKSAELP